MTESTELCVGRLHKGPVNRLQDLWDVVASTVSAGNVQRLSFNKNYQAQAACMCSCMHVALFDWM